MIRVETDRLIIRDTEPEDFTPLLRIYTQKINMQYISNGKYDWTMEELTAKYEKANASGPGYGLYPVELKSTGKIIGEAGLFHSFDNPDIAEFGYIIDSAYWARGFGSEICQGLINYSFDVLKKKKVVARMYAENVASVRLSEKLGMKQTECGKTPDGKLFYQYELNYSDV